MATRLDSRRVFLVENPALCRVVSRLDCHQGSRQVHLVQNQVRCLVQNQQVFLQAVPVHGLRPNRVAPLRVHLVEYLQRDPLLTQLVNQA